MSITQAYTRFIEHDLEAAVDLCTKAVNASGSHYVELQHDGTYNVFWINHTGETHTQGLLLSIPVLADNEWHEDEYERSYAVAEETLDVAFAAYLSRLTPKTAGQMQHAKKGQYCHNGTFNYVVLLDWDVLHPELILVRRLTDDEIMLLETSDLEACGIYALPLFLSK